MLAVVAFAITSCSKEAKINKKLEGTWVATTYDGVAVTTGFGYEVTFNKDEKNTGTGSYIVSLFGVPSSPIAFSYVLNEDKMTYTETVSGTVGTYTITTYTDEELQWTDADGKIAILQPK